MFKVILKFQILCLLVVTVSANAEDSNEIIDAKFDDWLKVCNTTNKNCVGVTFAENESGKRVGRFVLDLVQTEKPTIKAVGTLLIPYEAAIPHLASGIIMQLDQQNPIKEQFFFCDKSGCNVRYQFTTTGLDLLKSGSNILIKFKDVREVNSIKTMDISLNGIKPLVISIEKSN